VITGVALFKGKTAKEALFDNMKCNVKAKI